MFLSFRTLKERLRAHVESLTRQARLKTMKNGHQFMTIESRVGAKKTKSNPFVRLRMRFKKVTTGTV